MTSSPKEDEGSCMIYFVVADELVEMRQLWAILVMLQLELS